MSKVSIHIVTWNSMRYLPDALESIFSQTEQDFSVVVVDNASTDGVAEFVRGTYPQIAFLRNTKNLGFARAHNQAIALATSFAAKRDDALRYVLVTNPDIILTETYLERVLAAADRRRDAGSVGGTLYKVFQKGEDEFKDAERTKIIDTTGLRMFRTGRFAERGAGARDTGQYREGEVFGFSGALALYRLAALEEVKRGDEYFDEAYFAYKEDIDLAWRLGRQHWKAWFSPDAIAYHYRGAYGSEKRSLLRAFRERRAKSKLINRLSARNHIWLLAKNLDAKTFLLYSPLILGYELLKFLQVCLFEWSTLPGYLEALAGLPKMLGKRKR